MWVANRLIQNPCHAIYEKLEVLWAVQATEEVPEKVLWRGSGTCFWNGVEYQNQ